MTGAPTVQLYSPGKGELIVGSTTHLLELRGSQIIFDGEVDFRTANVTGLTARFG